MAKVLGAILLILSTLALVAQIFLVQNSSAYLTYNPADKAQGLVNVGLALPIVITVLAFIAGVVLSKLSTEPESH